MIQKGNQINEERPHGDQSSNRKEKQSKNIVKLMSHSIETFREVDIDEFDLNTLENYPQLECIDELVSPLIYCAYFGFTIPYLGFKEMCKNFLRNQKIDVDLESTNNKQTPLIVACSEGNYEIVRLLVLANAEVNKPNAFSYTPLTVILFRLSESRITFENTKVCFIISEFLINHGADVNWVMDKANGYSLLHFYCSVRLQMNHSQRQLNYKIIKFLLENGADVHQKTLKDKTATDLIENHCNKQQLKALILQYKERRSNQNVPKHNIKRLGDNYFKIGKHTDESTKLCND